MLNKILRKYEKNRLLILSFAIAIIYVFLTHIGLLPDNPYMVMLLCYITIYSIANSGFDILFGYTGQISLGNAGYYAIGAYVSAIMTSKAFGFSQWFGFTISPFVSMLCGALLAMLFGVLVSLPASRLVYHFLSLLTIAFGNIVYLFTSSASNLTNGFTGISRIPKLTLISGTKFTYNEFFYISVFILIVILILKQNFVYSKTGRALLAIRENSLAANGCGVHVSIYKVKAFAFNAFCTGLAGALYVHLIGFVSPEGFMYNQSVVFLTMLLFGGSGNLVGPIAGSVVIVFIKEGLQSFSNYQMLFYGLFILIVILFLPKGISGIVLPAGTRRKKVERPNA